MFKCKICAKEFETRQKLGGHATVHTRKIKPKIIKIHSCKFCGKIFNTGPQIAGHQNSCNLNPRKKEIFDKISKANKGKKISNEVKEKLSEKMKIAHKEGRAWNIGKSRWNNKPSYPEQFFMKVVENEFENKNYIREFNVGIYSIDFAWVDLKKAIEIDGHQHERFKEYKERDIRKDKFLKENGWDILRIKWSDFHKETKKYINISKNFIQNVVVAEMV